MKFKYLFALPIIATALMGCDEIEMSDAKPVENPQLPGITQEDFAVTPSEVMSNVMNLESLVSQTDDAASYMVELYTIESLTEDLPESAVLTGGLEFSATPDFAKSFVVADLSFTEGVCSAPLSSLLSIRNLMYGVDPNSFPVYFRVPVYVTVDGGQYRIGGRDYYFCVGEKFDQIGPDPGFKIEDAYYVFGPYVGGNSAATGVAMYHDDSSIYNNPVFSYAFEVSEDEAAAGFTLLVAPESVHNAGGAASACFGVGSEPGVLVEGGEPIKVEAAGPYMFEFNAQTFEYALKVAPNSLYAISLNGVSFNSCSQLGTSDFVTYDGMAGLLGAWGLTGQAAYRPTYYANNPDVEATAAENGTVTGGLLLDATGQPLNSENAIPFYSGTSAGLYYLTANLQSMAYTSYACKTLGFCGTINDWGATADATLSSKRSDNFMVWTGNVTVEAGSEWKLRANNDWVVNFGGANGSSYTTDGTPVELAMNGDNFVAAEAGTFTVTVNFRRTYQNGQLTPYTMTVVPAN